jgi:ribokinase
MARTPHLPVPGETVKGSIFKMGPGGKGFNQGVAAHKAGARVTMITKLGKDNFADVALDVMKELNMDTSRVFITEEVETGVALINVDETTSQNEIVVILGACNTISGEEVESITDVVKESEYLLTQLETNLSAIEKVIDIADQNGVKVILNTAPVQPVSDEVLSKVYLITPNEVEAEILTGICIDSEENAKKAAEWFFAKGVKNVLITLGQRGVFIATKERQAIIPAYKVNAIDTTGAGDAFNGGLVAALAEGKDIWEAAKFANALAAVAVQRLGTTPAMPTRAEIDEFIATH